MRYLPPHDLPPGATGPRIRLLGRRAARHLGWVPSNRWVNSLPSNSRPVTGTPRGRDSRARRAPMSTATTVDGMPVRGRRDRRRTSPIRAPHTCPAPRFHRRRKPGHRCPQSGRTSGAARRPSIAAKVPRARLRRSRPLPAMHRARNPSRFRPRSASVRRVRPRREQRPNREFVSERVRRHPLVSAPSRFPRLNRRGAPESGLRAASRPPHRRAARPPAANRAVVAGC